MSKVRRLISVGLPSGLRLSGQDMVLEEDIKLFDGTVMKKGKKYFTYDEIMALDAEGKLPHDAVVPTSDELDQVIDKVISRIRRNYGGEGHTEVEMLEQALGYGLNGWIEPRDMERYNADPENFDGVCHVGVCGCYLSDSVTQEGVSILFLCGDDGSVCVECGGREYGFSFHAVTY